MFEQQRFRKLKKIKFLSRYNVYFGLPQPLPKGKGFSNFNMRVCATFCEGFNV